MSKSVKNILAADCPKDTFRNEATSTFLELHQIDLHCNVWTVVMKNGDILLDAITSERDDPEAKAIVLFFREEKRIAGVEV